MSPNPGRVGDGGAIAILLAVCLTVVGGFGALGLDLAYARYVRLQLQNASDAASHAALVRLRASGSTAQAQQAAVAVAAQNVVAGKPLTLRTQDISFGGWNFLARSFAGGMTPANAVAITAARSATAGADGPIATIFGRILGFSSFNMADSAVTAYRLRSIVVAQDITGSFADNIDQAAAADVALLDQVYAFHLPADRIGMQLFTGAGTLWTPLTDLQIGYAAVRAQWAGDGKTTYDATKTSGITTCNKLDQDPASSPPYDHGWVPACSSGGNGSNPGAAIQAATSQLLASTRPYETRVIVLITDGEPECCSNTGGVISCSNTDGCAANLAQYGLDMADAAASAGVNIFTVAFGADPAQCAYVASLARGMGVAYNTPDPTQLSTILSEIAGAVPIAFAR